VEIPDVRYAKSGDVAIAYQVVGDGAVDVVFVRGFAGDLLSVWEQPLLARFVRELAGFARLLMLDKRGTGLSDRVRDIPTLETRMNDLRAVMDAGGLRARDSLDGPGRSAARGPIRGHGPGTSGGARALHPHGQEPAGARLSLGAGRPCLGEPTRRDP